MLSLWCGLLLRRGGGAVGDEVGACILWDLLLKDFERGGFRRWEWTLRWWRKRKRGSRYMSSRLE